MNEPILFFGNERLATGVTSPVLVLQSLIKAGYNVPAVVVAQENKIKSRKDRALEIEAVAEANNIPVLAPPKLKEAAADLQKYGAVAAVLVSYGKIIPQEVIDIFPKGIINIHPSLLPKHRGPTPIESVILSGEKETGVSLMQLAAKMDAGDVYAQETVLLRGDEAKQQLADQLLNMGAKMLVHYLPDILSGQLTPAQQNDSEATYDKKIEKEAAQLNHDKPAEELAREVRAYAGWPKSRVLLAKKELVVTQAHALPGNGLPGGIWIEGHNFGMYCSEGILAIDSLIPPGKKEMTAQAFLAGYPLI